ncbi:MAG: c-type cytochrome [Holophagaceae bacterium]|nr:c-type cytochrome [Holophagaceae bacterium]
MNRPALTLSLGALVCFAGMAQESNVKKMPTPYTSPGSGMEMYKAYCASCHGTDGTGNGPVASRLKTPTPDLTHLSRLNKGVFPAAHVAQVIRGEAGTGTHGVKDMPVWGPVFRVFNDRQESVVQQRVAGLTKYLEGLQVK